MAKKKRTGHGYIHIYTGEGKGKTTASVGLALRAKSRGLSVLFVQFMKTDSNGGEINLLQRLSIVVKRYTEIKPPHFYPDINIEEMRVCSLKAIEEVINIAAEYGLVVIDEFNSLVRANIISEKDAIDIIDRFPRDTELILTGRGATEDMINRADYVTYMKAVKHPMAKGQAAREGIEY